MEIQRKELRQFLVSWLVNDKIDLDIKKIIHLLDLVDECYEDKQMFDSWFRGYDVMN